MPGRDDEGLWQLEPVAFGGKRLLLILYLPRKAKQFQRALDRLSAACDLLSDFRPPAAEGVEVPLVTFNVA
jgi:hypothetical protein